MTQQLLLHLPMMMKVGPSHHKFLPNKKWRVWRTLHELLNSLISLGLKLCIEVMESVTKLLNLNSTLRMLISIKVDTITMLQELFITNSATPTNLLQSKDNQCNLINSPSMKSNQPKNQNRKLFHIIKETKGIWLWITNHLTPPHPSIQHNCITSISVLKSIKSILKFSKVHSLVVLKVN